MRGNILYLFVLAFHPLGCSLSLRSQLPLCSIYKLLWLHPRDAAVVTMLVILCDGLLSPQNISLRLSLESD
jgi:hypothetical protein